MEKEQLEENWEPALSNSRLSVPNWHTPSPKISFDRMTIVGDLTKDKAQYMADLLGNHTSVQLWDCMTHKFRGRIFTDKIYIEHDRFKADAWDRRNFRIEFNPNNLTADEMLWLKKNILVALENVGFTRLDLAFDFEKDLSDFFIMSDKALKKTVFYGRDGKAETKYFGVRDSDRFVRIYNKKQERKDNADIEMELEDFWRFEIEIKRTMVDEWKNCFEDFSVIQPNYTLIENDSDRHSVMAVLFDEQEWGRMNRKKKYKIKKILKEISPVDLTNLMKLSLREQENKLQKQIDFWLS
ncbi:replication initiation factor domain-containing protein [Macrococcus equipercicus]|uniref:Replication initiation protein n=1 Tax=Macrococcus equipercicus TaxID=69967 RepID=A0ABQ6R632_9STAP|nr:replication initiation factor domain-containing protein [Macrococcus equipercicus]KAA1035415.1 replication initiation factor domain-containing protein [Macrococcus equipercicus]